MSDHRQFVVQNSQSAELCACGHENQCYCLEFGNDYINHYYDNSWLRSIATYPHRLKVKENKKLSSEKFFSLYSEPSQ